MAVRRSSNRFLECIEDCFLVQNVDVLMRNGALLDLLSTNQENLLDNITANDSLVYSDHNIVEFNNLLNTLRVGSKTRILDFRRGNFNMFRAHLRGIPDDKGACERWEIFKNTPLEAQEQSIPFKGKESR